MNVLGITLRIAAAAAILVAVPSLARAQVGAPDTVDHYKVYNVEHNTFQVNQPVFLQDQFGPRDMFVRELEKWSNPVNKNNEGIFRPDRHYAWWRVENPSGASGPVYDIVVGNQFGGGQLWKIQRPHWLLAPTRKNDPAGQFMDGDHYLCYDVLNGPILQKPVTMQDQFGPRTALVDTAECFCNPVFKQHNGIPYPVRHPDVHLACYRFDPQQQYGINILMHDQFYFGPAVVLNDCWICVPSTKQIVTSVKQSTWGQLRQLYQ